MIDADAEARLAPLVARALCGPAAITRVQPLAGGAVRRHYRIDAQGSGEARMMVLRTEGASPLGMGLDLVAEFALLEILAANGIAVPEPLFACA